MSAPPGGDARASAPSLSYRVREAAAFLRSRGLPPPRVGLVLGSGLGGLADEIASPVVVPYEEIPHFPVSTVAGHAGRLVGGRLEGVSVVAMQGRVHFYEGYSLQEATFPVRVMARLGAEVLVVTNAAGGLHPSLRTGDVMLICDHINLMGLAGFNPLVGLNEPELGVRFLDMLSAYDARLLALAREAAAEAGVRPREGVYVMVAGPTYETMAEIRFLQRIGADAVGMSTIPEVIVARHEGMRVLGISAITDTAAGEQAESEISHAQVLAVAERLGPTIAALVRGVLRRLG